ncbi:hypothetical protein ACQKMD_01150 [Viridibacillus sp. NPDC096237]|uniref:hypothetical protein n=1 Tax=Viridibacillus sp. NPDC096237 TaxID=3390721 RepID=UPI003CFC81BD
MLKKMLSMITDALEKNPNSNIGKIFSVFASQYTDAQDTLKCMEEWTDIEKAQGKVLDEIGDEINQARGTASDGKYRLLIRAKRARALSDGTVNKIIEALAFTLNVNAKEIKVQPLWNGVEPAAIMIESIPLEKLVTAGINTAQFEEVIEDVVAAGVAVYLSATGSTDWLCLSGSAYTFPVNYRITNRFRTAPMAGLKVDVPLTLFGTPYQWDVEYKRCGAFRTGGSLDGRNSRLAH